VGRTANARINRAPEGDFNTEPQRLARQPNRVVGYPSSTFFIVFVEMEEMANIQSWVPIAQREQFARLAEASGRSLSGEVRRALDVYLRLSEVPGVVPDPPTGRPETGERRGLARPAAARGEDG
jgi:hypothetical protein